MLETSHINALLLRLADPVFPAAFEVLPGAFVSQQVLMALAAIHTTWPASVQSIELRVSPDISIARFHVSEEARASSPAAVIWAEQVLDLRFSGDYLRTLNNALGPMSVGEASVVSREDLATWAGLFISDQKKATWEARVHALSAERASENLETSLAPAPSSPPRPRV